jgi:glycosyltransferase involved in cell wall biosynthesis
MNIHIINPYGTLPSEGWRKYRANIIAEQLAKYNHNVTLWISNIDHRSKCVRTRVFTKLKINDNLQINIIPSIEYKSNASLGRILYERKFAVNVKYEFNKSNLFCDCIIISDPCLFYGDIINDIVFKSKSKLIIDILDIWPEVFITLFPRKLRVIVDFLFKPLYVLRDIMYRKSDGIIAVTPDYLQNALIKVKNKPSQVVYIGIDFNEININSTAKINIGVEKSDNEKWIIYAGTLGLNYDIRTIMDFADKIEKSNLPYKLIIAGDGPMKDFIVKTILNKTLTKTIYLGRLNVVDLNFLYAKCDIALSTYLETSTVSMPVKAFDYIAYGLPMINSLKRELGALIHNRKIGLQYIPENSDSLFKETQKLLSDVNLYNEMKQNALNLSQEFSIDNQYVKFVNFVDNICNTQ